MHAVVVSFDRWSLGFLGCYGNPTAKTPNFDRWAARAVVFDQHFGENFDRDAANHAWWTGRYQFPLRRDEQAAVPSIFDAANSTDMNPLFLVDEGSSFAQQIEAIDSERGRVEFAGQEEVFHKAIALICAGDLTPEEQSLLWVQSRGPRLAGGVKKQAADAVSDYARQAEEFDALVGKLLDTVISLSETAQPLLIITAAEGECVLSTHDPDVETRELPEERVHCPLLISIPGMKQAGSRRQALTQAVDIGPTLADWFAADVSSLALDGSNLLPLIDGGTSSVREQAYWGEGGSHAIRDGDFYLLRGEAGRSQLFLKPEDRYERADVAAQYADVADEMEEQLKVFLERQFL